MFVSSTQRKELPLMLVCDIPAGPQSSWSIMFPAARPDTPKVAARVALAWGLTEG
jgi:hypothetical protein